ncbi:hypothetical protein LOTGIDRAFT_238630 [Lottia gigantea]|uniref:THAP-type domain-containing protein n=1 Tax=Lottia gigantea TaxID=225164 RepID=V4A8F3_LOTGI|nr:hypothetical protein LOTGIDRAFT_238630 [Lottia gigantea]ESP00249.1 hypothetical protein LOTGIDRAFT_238630 [Lottia gigantea]
MPCCAAVNCKEKPIPKYLNEEKENDKRITFHKFPGRDPQLFQIWLHNLRREDFTPSRSSSLCSRHFEEKYIHRLGGNVTLMKGAIPTIFDYPAHLLDHIIYSKPEPEPEPEPEAEANDSFTDDSYDLNDIDSVKRKYEADIEKLKQRLTVSQEKARKFQRKAQQLEKELKSLQENKDVFQPSVKVLSRSRQIVKNPV